MSVLGRWAAGGAEGGALDGAPAPAAADPAPLYRQPLLPLRRVDPAQPVQHVRRLYPVAGGHHREPGQAGGETGEKGERGRRARDRPPTPLPSPSPPQITLLWCPTCERYLQPPKHWARAAPESAELLAICLKRVRGLPRVRLIDAGFVWTEPHSRRLKVKLTVQAEVVGGATLQQGCVVDYVVETHQCLDCTRAATNAESWVASVQVRQHVTHKRTFFYLEQAILRAKADAGSVGVRAVHGGLDFYFSSRARASSFVEFVESTVPAR